MIIFCNEGASPEGRKEIEDMTGFGNHTILEWVNMADLYRVKGVGGQYSELLRKAGVDTVVELSKRVAEHLYKAMVDVNETKHVVHKMPTKDQLEDWIQQARKLPRVITY